VGCQSQPAKPSNPYLDQAKQDMPAYLVNKNQFYGYELLNPVPALLTGTKVQFDKQTGGNKYVFPDPKKAFTFITLYETNGILTRLTLSRADVSTSQSEQFYQMVMKNAEKTYPDKVLVNSGIGAFMHFINNPNEWQSQYAEYLQAKNKKAMYKLNTKGFNYGLHESLKTVSFNQFAGEKNKVYVVVDYITSEYERASKNTVQNHGDALKTM